MLSKAHYDRRCFSLSLCGSYNDRLKTLSGWTLQWPGLTSFGAQNQQNGFFLSNNPKTFRIVFGCPEAMKWFRLNRIVWTFNGNSSGTSVVIITLIRLVGFGVLRKQTQHLKNAFSCSSEWRWRLRESERGCKRLLSVNCRSYDANSCVGIIFM